MKKYLNNLQSASKHLRLSAAEKQAMRAMLRERFAGQARPLESPFFSYFTLRSFSIEGQFTLARLVPALAIVLLVGAGTASAAQSALPGDLLYPVKVSVSEPLQGAFVVTASEKARFHASLAERRLEEAQTLAARGTLDASAAEVVETNFDIQANQVEERLVALEESDPASAAEIKVTFASTLETRAALLARSSAESANEEVKERSAHIVNRLLARVVKKGSGSVAIATTRSMATSNQADTEAGVEIMAFSAPAEPAPSSVKLGIIADDESRKKVAEELQKKATSTLASVVKRFVDPATRFNGTSHTQISVEISAARTLMEQGGVALAAGEHSSAEIFFSEALSIATKLHILLKAQSVNEVDVISPILVPHTSDGAIINRETPAVSLPAAPAVPSVQISL